MIKVKALDTVMKTYYRCQVCGEDSENKIFSITLLNRNNQGTEVRLCKNCCKELRSLLKFTQLNGVKMVSIDDIDK